MTENLPAKPDSQILIYQTESGETRIEVHLQDETVWLTQKGMAALFQTSKQNIGLHLRNVFKGKELEEDSVVKEFLTTAADGEKLPDKVLQSRCHYLCRLPHKIESRYSLSTMGDATFARVYRWMGASDIQTNE